MSLSSGVVVQEDDSGGAVRAGQRDEVLGLAGIGAEELKHGVSELGHCEWLVEERHVEGGEGEQVLSYFRAGDLGRSNDDGKSYLHAVEDRERVGEAEADMAAVGDQEVGGLAGDFAQGAVTCVALRQFVISEAPFKQEAHAVADRWLIVAEEYAGGTVPLKEGDRLRW
jgi:hypothetical protein